jgi:hypothetical protein
MLEQIERPNFFPGQLIDYRDFNRLASHSGGLLQLLCKHLYPRGGVLLGALEEFALEPGTGLGVRIAPGMALLPDGKALLLNQSLLVD